MLFEYRVCTAVCVYTRSCSRSRFWETYLRPTTYLRPRLWTRFYWMCVLHAKERDSAWFESLHHIDDAPPLHAALIEAGPRARFPRGDLWCWARSRPCGDAWCWPQRWRSHASSSRRHVPTTLTSATLYSILSEWTPPPTWSITGGGKDQMRYATAKPWIHFLAVQLHQLDQHGYVSNARGRQCSNLTPIFIGVHRNAPLSHMKRVPGHTTPMVPMHLAPMAPMHFIEQIRALAVDRWRVRSPWSRCEFG